MCQTTEAVCRFYIIWCIVIGILCALCNSGGLAIVMAALKLYNELNKAAKTDGKGTLVFGVIICVFGLLISLSYIIAGILLALGMSKGSRGLFQAGKIMSYFLPIIYSLGILFPAIHIMCAKKLSEYSRGRWSS